MADQNPGDFFKLYGRLLPASSTNELDGPQELLVRMAFNPQPLLTSVEAVVERQKEGVDVCPSE